MLLYTLLSVCLSLYVGGRVEYGSAAVHPAVCLSVSLCRWMCGVWECCCTPCCVSVCLCLGGCVEYGSAAVRPAVCLSVCV